MHDPRNKEIWIKVEDMIRQTQQRVKLQSILTAAVGVSESEVKDLYNDRQETMNADFVLFDVNRMVPDTAVKVADDDLKKTYADHQEDYRTKATRKIKYVVFAQTPSAQDSASALTEITKLLDQAKSGTTDFSEFVKTYSENPSDDKFHKHGELSRPVENAAFAAKKGQIVGPIKDGNGYHLIKVLDERQGSQEELSFDRVIFLSTAFRVRTASTRSGKRKKFSGRQKPELILNNSPGQTAMITAPPFKEATSAGPGKELLSSRSRKLSSTGIPGKLSAPSGHNSAGIL